MVAFFDITAATMATSTPTSLEAVKAAIRQMKEASPKPYIKVVSRREYEWWEKFYEEKDANGST